MKYVVISIVVHILFLNFIWVGFSAPLGDNRNTFTYLGKLFSVQAEDQVSGLTRQSQKQSEAINFNDDTSGRWIKERFVEKLR